MLKRETHLLSDFSQLVEGKARDVLTLNANRTRIRPLKADDEPQQHALSSAAASKHGEGLSTTHTQTDSIENGVTVEGLPHIAYSDGRRSAVILGDPLLHRIVIGRGHVGFTSCSSEVKERRRE
jgi:hypothetical protein